MSQHNTARGIGFMSAAALIFAAQDGISRHLAAEYNVLMIVMIRYWFFAAFVCALAARAPGGLRGALRTRFPVLQALRGVILAAEVAVMFVGFVTLGLIESNAIFTAYPLLVAALSGPILGEKVGWRRWSAIGVGFVGVLIILQPGTGVFSPYALVPFAAALMFAVYSLLTRYVARGDAAAVSFLYTGVVGALSISLVGIWFWEPMSRGDWAWMAVLCVSAAAGHWSLIKAYEAAEASAVQPFAYLQLVLVSIIGLTVFGETLRSNVVIGCALVVAAGLFTLWRARVRARAAARG
jgi:drug/metabolite transporter (DMT)-like permease